MTPVFVNPARRVALIVVDPQYDFCPGGALAVADGDSIFPAINALREKLAFSLVALTQDWHPADHASFASNHPGAALFSTIELGDMGKQVRQHRFVSAPRALLWMPLCRVQWLLSYTALMLQIYVFYAIFCIIPFRAGHVA